MSRTDGPRTFGAVRNQFGAPEPVVTRDGKHIPGGSTLAPGPEAALRSVGLVPAGVISAGSVFVSPFRFDDPFTAKRRGGYTESFTGSTNAITAFAGWNWEQVLRQNREEGGRQTALEELARVAGASQVHGVVGITFTVIPRTDFPAAWAEVLTVSEVVVSGTAVVAPGAPRPRRPFTTHLDGSAVAKLLRSGWCPSTLVVGAGVVSTAMSNATFRNRFRMGNVELTQYSSAVNRSWAIAIRRLTQHASGLGGVVVGVDATHRFHRGDQDVYVAEVQLVGTAATRFAPAQPEGAGGMVPILSLADR